MVPAYENVSKWFDIYFEDVRKNQGDLNTVPNLKKYFAPNLEFIMYTAPSSSPGKTMSRDSLLMSFVHPGLYEEIVPRHTVIDLKQRIVAVQFEIRFRDEPSGRQWAPLQASAHYHWTADESGGLQISKIQYWTEPLPEDIFEFWAKRREEALAKHAMDFINSRNP